MESSFDVSRMADRLKHNNIEHEREMADLRRKAGIEAERLVHLLKLEIPDIVKLWGFGSVFESHRPFTESSDIDLAFEGGSYFEAYKIVEKSSFRVDLIDITGKNDNFASLIRSRGKLL